MNNKILILTEAGKKIGFGHYTRCSALRQAFTESGFDTQMYLFLNEFDIDDSHVIKSNWLDDSFQQILNYPSETIIIVDSYLAEKKHFEELSKKFITVVAVDDYNRISYPVTQILNPNVFFSEMDYTNQTASLFGGKDFVILRPEFRKDIAFRVLPEQIENILITIGGSDYRALLPKLISICLKTPAKKIIAIAPEGITGIETNDRLLILPSQNASDMARLMEESDITIAACGQTLHELASRGTATIGIGLDIDQVPNQKFYLNNGFLPIDIQWNDPVLSEKIYMGIAQLSALDKRLYIKETAPTFIDKNGVSNIVSYITQLL